MKFRSALPLWVLPITLFAMPIAAFGDGAGDNSTDNVRHIPPPGIAVSEADRGELQTGLNALEKAIAELKTISAGAVSGQPPLLPDVEIYYKAADYALKYNEFFSPGEVRSAKAQIQQGLDRAMQLKMGKAPWTTQTGPIVRGYRSKIDGSVQPYGLIVPVGYDFAHRTPARIDIWFHGRGENLSEVNFINDSQRSMGEFAPPAAFVLRPYGRYCNPSRFAGETDTFEALDAIRKAYGIDERRIAVRGFSLGGAACWDFTVHFAGDWAAANPGAGFSETADFLNVFQNETLKPTWYEQKLWHLYDATDYAINLYDCPTVAYSGELDSQRQAAEMMVQAASGRRIDSNPHYWPWSTPLLREERQDRCRSACRRSGRKGPRRCPYLHKVHYLDTKVQIRMKWVTLDAMGQHWERARINADISPNGALAVTTLNAEAFTLNLPKELAGTKQGRPTSLSVDGENVPLSAGAESNNAWTLHIHKSGSNWIASRSIASPRLAKRHNLQGPIDDAFMDSFIMVQPTGAPINEKVGAWAQGEMKHAVAQWRQQFRGDAVVKDDTAITGADIANSNLILWGDPRSNKLLARILSRLPLHWDANGIQIGTRTYPGANSAAILIYPNPLNAKKYIVLNSGFTYREYDYLNNARQTPKLPDWAIVDVDTPANSRFPGKIVDANFFGEQWQVQALHSETALLNGR